MTLLLDNLSSTPIIILYWELLFCERNAFCWKIYLNKNLAEDTCDLCIVSHSSKKLTLMAQINFQWNDKALGGIAGKRRIIKD